MRIMKQNANNGNEKLFHLHKVRTVKFFMNKN